MKYIISENRYRKLVFQYLNNIDYVEHIDKTDGEIFLGAPDGFSGEYLYDTKEKELLIKPDIINTLVNFYGMDEVDARDAIEKWFKMMYNVEIKKSYAWDW